MPDDDSLDTEVRQSDFKLLLYWELGIIDWRFHMIAFGSSIAYSSESFDNPIVISL